MVNMADAGNGGGNIPQSAGDLVEAATPPVNEYFEARKALVVSTTTSNSVLATSQMRTKMHDPDDLVELARFVQSADSHTKGIVGGKLELISEQIKALQQQARGVLEDARRDLELTHAKCNFQRRPGKIYHLYRKVDAEGTEEKFFSMLSPLEWGGTPPNEYLDSYRLEHDMSWTQVDRIVERDERRKFDPAILGLNAEQVAAANALPGSATTPLRLTSV
jgi:hypothetical protein